MDNNVVQQIKDAIAQSQSIGVVAPKNPSMDEMAAALSLYLLLKSTNKNVSIASPSDPIVEISSLVGIDKVEKALKGSGGVGDLTVSFPYTEGEIEKVSYTLEEGYLNIIVKAAEQGLTFDEKDVEYTRGGGNLDLVFTVGAPNLADLDPVFDTQNLDIKIVNIDNKEENEQFGDIVLISQKLSSLSEGVADLALSLGLHIDEDSAQNLLNGISSETGNFQDSKTSSLAFEMAALLMKKGATRVSSASARRGISIDQDQQRGVRPQVSAQQSAGQRRAPSAAEASTDAKALADRSVGKQDKREQDRQKFEENLQKRVQEEKAREASGQPRNTQPVRNQQIENKNQPTDEAADADETPTDWLAPKVYKGSSEV